MEKLTGKPAKLNDGTWGAEVKTSDCPLPRAEQFTKAGVSTPAFNEWLDYELLNQEVTMTARNGRSWVAEVSGIDGFSRSSGKTFRVRVSTRKSARAVAEAKAGPATAKQVAFLAKLATEAGVDAPTAETSGEASRLIEELKTAAAAARRAARRAEAAAERAEAAAERGARPPSIKSLNFLARLADQDPGFAMTAGLPNARIPEDWDQARVSRAIDFMLSEHGL